jgi:hypothetical protein
MRTRWRFGSNRRLVATIERLRLWPNDGPFAHTWQTFGMAGEYSFTAQPPLKRTVRTFWFIPADRLV